MYVVLELGVYRSKTEEIELLPFKTFSEKYLIIKFVK